jgi:hypothetical protein
LGRWVGSTTTSRFRWCHRSANGLYRFSRRLGSRSLNEAMKEAVMSFIACASSTELSGTSDYVMHYRFALLRSF